MRKSAAQTFYQFKLLQTIWFRSNRSIKILIIVFSCITFSVVLCRPKFFWVFVFLNLNINKSIAFFSNTAELSCDDLSGSTLPLAYDSWDGLHTAKWIMSFFWLLPLGVVSKDSVPAPHSILCILLFHTTSLHVLLKCILLWLLHMQHDPLPKIFNLPPLNRISRWLMDGWLTFHVNSCL